MLSVTSYLELWSLHLKGWSEFSELQGWRFWHEFLMCSFHQLCLHSTMHSCQSESLSNPLPCLVSLFSWLASSIITVIIDDERKWWRNPTSVFWFYNFIIILLLNAILLRFWHLNCIILWFHWFYFIFIAFKMNNFREILLEI